MLSSMTAMKKAGSYGFLVLKNMRIYLKKKTRKEGKFLWVEQQRKKGYAKKRTGVLKEGFSYGVFTRAWAAASIDKAPTLLQLLSWLGVAIRENEAAITSPMMLLIDTPNGFRERVAAIRELVEMLDGTRDRR